jgi:hypothetical protein
MEISNDFTVYGAGPFSRELTCSYYDQRAKLESLQTDYKLTQSDAQVLEKILKESVLPQFLSYNCNNMNQH